MPGTQEVGNINNIYHGNKLYRNQIFYGVTFHQQTQSEICYHGHKKTLLKSWGFRQAMISKIKIYLKSGKSMMWQSLGLPLEMFCKFVEFIKNHIAETSKLGNTGV